MNKCKELEYLQHSPCLQVLHICSSKMIVLPFTGKDRDVGEVLVKSLQDTKYSIDEKLEKSFINLFSKKPNLVSEAQSDVKDKTDGSGEERGVEDSDGLESSDEDEAIHKDSTVRNVDSDTDEENTKGEEQPFSKDNVKEHIEFHEGRVRRRAVFGNVIDQDDVMVRQLNDVSGAFALCTCIKFRAHLLQITSSDHISIDISI